MNLKVWSFKKKNTETSLGNLSTFFFSGIYSKFSIEISSNVLLGLWMAISWGFFEWIYRRILDSIAEWIVLETGEGMQNRISKFEKSQRKWPRNLWKSCLKKFFEQIIAVETAEQDAKRTFQWTSIKKLKSKCRTKSKRNF